MELVKDTPFEVAHFHFQVDPPRDALIVVVKAAFTPRHEAEAEIAAEQVPLAGDVFEGDDPSGALVLCTDLAVHKPRGEYLVYGHARSGGGTVLQTAVAVQVGALSKAVAVFGDRHWTAMGRLQGPTPFEAMPLTWSRAFGGPRVATNPVGRGVQRVETPNGTVVPLPNLEHPTDLIATPDDRPRPWGFGPRAPAWAARSRHQGTYDARWRRLRWPWLPEDFSWDHHMAAPDDQQIPGYWRGDEAVAMQHLVAGFPVLRTRLPGVRPRAFVSGPGGFREVALQCDTVVLDGDLPAVSTVWRGMLAVSGETMPELTHLFVLHDTAAAPRTLDQCRARFEEKLREDAAPEPVEEPPPVEPGAPAEPAAEAPANDDEPPFTPPEVAPLPTADEARAQMASLGIEAPAEYLALLAESERGAVAEAPPIAAPEGPTRADVIAMHGRGESLAGLDLTGVDLSECDLAGADFKGAILERASFVHASLVKADFTEAVLPGAFFDNADLAGALFADADLTGASLLRVDAAGAVFDGAVAVGSRWGGSRLDGASMKKIDLTGARLTRCRIAGAALDGADLSETLLDESVLQGSSLVEATLEGARGVRVDLRDCDLTKLQAGDGLVLTESVLTGVKADGSVWDRARLDQCAFSFGKFTDATFSDASLVKARLDGCVLRGARFDRASLVGATMLKSDLLEARFEGADLSWCDLRGASLFRASLLRAKTEGAQWERADLTGTLLERTE